MAGVQVTVERYDQEFMIAYEAPKSDNESAFLIRLHPKELSADSLEIALKRKPGEFNKLFSHWEDLFLDLPADAMLIPSSHLDDDKDKARLATLRAFVQIIESELNNDRSKMLEDRLSTYTQYCKLLSNLFSIKFRAEGKNVWANFRVYNEDSLEILLEGIYEAKEISFEQWWEAIKIKCESSESTSNKTVTRAGAVSGLGSSLNDLTSDKAAAAIPRTTPDPKVKLAIILRKAISFALGLSLRPLEDKLAFASFLKAYCDFAQRKPDMVASLQIPLSLIHTSIVILENDPWQEREFITKVFLDVREPEQQDAMLDVMLRFVKDSADLDANAVEPATSDLREYRFPEKARRIAFAIAEQYLSGYRIGKAMKALRAPSKPGLMLKLLLHCYRWISFYFPCLLLVFLAFIVLSKYVAQYTIPVIASASLVLIVIISLMIMRDNTTPLRLLFPRLFGAIMVGIAPLLTDQVPYTWNWGQLGYAIFPAIGITYLGALVYLYLEVEMVLKQSPAGNPRNNDSNVKKKDRNVIRKTALILFAIGIAESLFIATVTLTLFAPVLSAREIEVYEISWGMTWPKVVLELSRVLLWAGTALFLGSFLQLLWQDRRVTSIR